MCWEFKVFDLLFNNLLFFLIYHGIKVIREESENAHGFWVYLFRMLCSNFVLHDIDTQHQFNARESDWGFTSFMPLGELYDPTRGYLVNDTLVVEAEVLVRRIVDYWTYDSKKETGYVGLKNQGATCYMNSLLQTLYHIPYFRKVRPYFSFLFSCKFSCLTW